MDPVEPVEPVELGLKPGLQPGLQLGLWRLASRRVLLTNLPTAAAPHRAPHHAPHRAHTVHSTVHTPCPAPCRLTTFDSYDGRTLSHGSDVAVVPNGENIAGPDIRGGGDWYVGVQALPGEEAEYSLTLTLVDTPPFDASYKCDRLNGPCPHQRMAGEGQSGAMLRPTASGVWAALLVASTAALVRRWV